MVRRSFGPSGWPVPVVGLGTWNMEQDERSRAILALRAGIDAGATHIDTAELYGSGAVERDIVAPAIRGIRDRVFLVSKVLPIHASREGTVVACERSLQRLGTDWLDLYLLHWPGDEPLEDTISAFEQLVTDGKIRGWGVSNFDVDDLQEVVRIAGDGKLACNQVLYHLGQRAIEHGVVPWCREHGVAVVGYSPFGSGDFPSPRSKGGRVLAEVARASEATPRQVALAFLAREPHVFVIPKAADPAHARENAAAGDLVLDAVDLSRIDRAFPRGPRLRELPYV